MSQTEDKLDANAQLQIVLQERAEEVYGASAEVKELTRLSTGASREAWSFDVVYEGETTSLILKRDPILFDDNGKIILPADDAKHSNRITEGKLFELGRKHGVIAPEVPFFIESDDRTTQGFVSVKVEGETLGRRILRDDKFAEARAKLAHQCGFAAARIHNIPIDEMPEVYSMNVEENIEHQRGLLDSVDHPYPGFEFALRWLQERKELAGNQTAVVHGDYRLGNILVGPDGLRGVLDWEIAHIGNPIMDLGWICLPAWRYGHRKPVGGFGEYEQLLEGYKEGGGADITIESIQYWEVFGALRWGVMCINMGFSHINGPHHSLEKAAIGRRTAETEYDLLKLIH